MIDSAKRPGRSGLLKSSVGNQNLGGRITRSNLRPLQKVPNDGRHRDIAMTLEWMDAMGVDYACMFPTPMLFLGLHPQVEIEVALPEPHVLAGFENHGGRTRLGSGQGALGRVLKGHGNDGRSGLEGAMRANTIGTYLHGPLLPKNVWFADWLIARALGLDPAELARLDDELENEAHAGARAAAGV